MADEPTEDVTGPEPENLPEVDETPGDPCLADATYEEYCLAQEAFPGFVDEDGNPTDDDVAEGDEYVRNPDA